MLRHLCIITDRTYIYNKAFYEEFLNEAKKEAKLFYDHTKTKELTTLMVRKSFILKIDLIL